MKQVYQVQKRGKVEYTAAIVVKMYYSPEYITRDGKVTPRLCHGFNIYVLLLYVSLRIFEFKIGQDECESMHRELQSRLGGFCE